jgi:hypothetical protein
MPKREWFAVRLTIEMIAENGIVMSTITCFVTMTRRHARVLCHGKLAAVPLVGTSTTLTAVKQQTDEGHLLQMISLSLFY